MKVVFMQMVNTKGNPVIRNTVGIKTFADILDVFTDVRVPKIGETVKLINGDTYAVVDVVTEYNKGGCKVSVEVEPLLTTDYTITDCEIYKSNKDNKFRESLEIKGNFESSSECYGVGMTEELFNHMNTDDNRGDIE